MKKKRLLAAILAAALMLSLLPVPVSAAGEDPFIAGGIKYKVLTEFESTGTVEVIANGYSGDITIPATVDNGGITYTVTAIGLSAFQYCTGLTSVTIPGSVTSINNFAFSDCTGLTSVTIPDSVTSIGPYVFYGCSGLTSVEIPGSVTSIGISVFNGCSGLTSVTIHDGVISIGGSAFSGCTKLTSVEIPGSVASIGEGAFYGCTDLTSMTILDGVTSIGKMAFYACPLTSMEIPGSVTSIGESAFEGCNSLESVTFLDGVTSIGKSAFAYCPLTSVEIPGSVTSIGESAFDYTGLISIAFSSSTPPFDSYMFYGVSAGLLVIVPHGATSAYEAALTYMLLSGTVIKETVDITAISGVTAPVRGEAPATAITGTDQYAGSIVWAPADNPFEAGTAYTATITLTPEDGYTLTGVAANSFTVTGATTVSNTANSGVITAVFPATAVGIGGTFITGGIKYKVLTESETTGTVEVIANSYSGNITIPATVSNGGITYTVTTIGDSAFENCSSLESVTFPDSVTSIGANAFYGCSDLESVTFPGSVTSIGEWAFYGCSSLESVMLPGSVTSIGQYAFYGCSGLTSVEFPDSLISIGDSAFYGCSSLSSAYFNGESPTIGAAVFSGTASEFKIYYDENFESTWSNPWNGYETAIFTAVEWQSATADGATDSATSTKINLTFDKPITGLTAADITITDGTGAVVKGALTGSGTSWSIALTAVITQGNISVAVAAPAGHPLTGSPKAVAVYKSPTQINYSVTFNSTGGSPVSKIDYVGSGSVISAPETPILFFYTFGGWYKEPSCTNPWNFSIDTVNSNITLYAKWISFMAPSHTVSVSANPAAGGSVSGGGSYMEGASVAVTATANSRYRFVNWTENNIPVSTNTAYTFVLGTTNRTLAANFAVDVTFIAGGIKYKVLTESGSTGTVEVIANDDGYNGDIIIPAAVSNEGINYIVTAIGDNAFENCFSLESVTIPGSVTSIGNWAFADCSSLTSIAFSGSTPPTFGIDVFDGIPSGLQILVPSGSASDFEAALSGMLPADTVIKEPEAVISITEIPVTAPVTGAAPVTTITETEQYTGSIGWYPEDDLFVKDTVYTATITLLPKEGYTLTGVAANSFTVTGATTISNPANSGIITADFPVTEAEIFDKDGIRYRVLTESGDTGTVEVIANSYTGIIIIPETVVNRDITYTVTAIGDHAFYNCNSLESISIPASVTVIGEYAFRHCSSLESVNLPDSVTAIGKYAFANCSGLESVYISENVTVIGEYVFRYCSSLESVNIPGSVTTIGYGAFAYCYGLTSVEIPGSVTAIGDSAFYDCDSLTSAYFNGDAPTAGIEIFDGTASGFKIYYFYSASGWSNPWNGYETAAVAMAIELQSATADGTADTATSTKIDLTFDTAITGLTADDITITNGTGAAIKGALTGSGTSWSIALTSVTTQGNISVAVAAPAGYTLTGSPKAVAVCKVLPPITYVVTFDSQSGSQVSSISNVSFGSAISAPAAPARTGYTFGGWYKEASCTNAWNFSTDTVTSDTILYAKWTVDSSDSGGNGSSGDDSGSESNTETTTPEKKPDQPVTAAASVTAKAGTKGTASASIPDKAITDAIAKAQTDAKAQGKAASGISVVLNVTMPQGATSLTATLSQTALQSLVSAGVSSLELKGAPVSLGLDLKALQEIQKQSTGKITISITPATGLSKAAKALVGNRPVYNIIVTYTDKNKKSQSVSSLGSGTATLSIPYAPDKNEAVGYLFGVYVDGKGNASRIGSSVYDANSRSILLDTNHFSVYGVGYTVPAVKFTDIESHWAKESIDYIVGRGLISGVSKTAFSPDTAMTRGVLATALGKLAGVDVKLYTTNSFTDVKADSPFRPYIEWAYKEGIIQDIGNSRFAPNRAITREEIAVIIANYAKATGYALPVLREAVTYADNSNIGSVYQTAVKAMQQAGIMMGGTGNKFNPRFDATRAEVSSMLYRYIKLTIDPSTAQGWALNDAGQYFYYKDGKALTGWQTVDSTRYFFNADGTLKTGWVQDEANWRYYSGNKAPIGWWDIGSGESKKTYYFTKDGLMVSGKWLQIDGKWYYFTADGSLARSTKINGYEVDEKGIRKTK